jgi:hypothetical protein
MVYPTSTVSQLQPAKNKAHRVANTSSFVAFRHIE